MDAHTVNDLWDQIRAELRQQWPKLTEDELDIVDGSLEKLYGLMQEKCDMQRQDVDHYLGKLYVTSPIHRRRLEA